MVNTFVKIINQNLEKLSLYSEMFCYRIFNVKVTHNIYNFIYWFEYKLIKMKNNKSNNSLNLVLVILYANAYIDNFAVIKKIRKNVEFIVEII